MTPCAMGARSACEAVTSRRGNYPPTNMSLYTRRQIPFDRPSGLRCFARSSAPIGVVCCHLAKALRAVYSAKQSVFKNVESSLRKCNGLDIGQAVRWLDCKQQTLGVKFSDKSDYAVV